MSLGTRWRIQQTSTQARPKFIQQKELHYSLPQLKVALGTGIASHQHLSCSVVQSITMVEKLHQLQHSSAYNSKKMILKKIYLSWWTTQSLASLLYVYLFLYIDLFIAGKFFFVYDHLFLCIHWFSLYFFVSACYHIKNLCPALNYNCAKIMSSIKLIL